MTSKESATQKGTTDAKTSGGRDQEKTSSTLKVSPFLVLILSKTNLSYLNNIVKALKTHISTRMRYLGSSGISRRLISTLSGRCWEHWVPTHGALAVPCCMVFFIRRKKENKIFIFLQ